MSQPLDYKELLKKYMSTVIGCEGYSFTGVSDERYSGNVLTDQERRALKDIEKELGYE